MNGLSKGKILVVGGRGIVGRSVIEYFSELPLWEVIGVSRNKPEFNEELDWINVDLKDLGSCEAKLSHLNDITHIFYSAVFEKPDLTRGWSQADHAFTNLQMLRNLVTIVDKTSSNLQHITIMQGTKAYGGHLGPFKMPARETDPRSMGPNFYYDQMDWLADYQRGKSWHWTILRPQLVCGIAVGSPLNIMAAIGTFAAISRESGIPLRFPGGPERVGEATDARLIAKGVEWAGKTQLARNQIYNITNGDIYIWHHLWPRVADLFSMEFAPAQPMSLDRIMPENKKVWDTIVNKFELQGYSLDALVPSWRFADFLFGYGQRPNPHHMSNIKIRQHGFHECVDTEESMLDLLIQMQTEKIIPK
jgi:nucleoside-diphosphate-sugar epimerase